MLQRWSITYDRQVGDESLRELTELIASDHRGAGNGAARAEPWARRAANLDFHGAVVEAAHNTLLSHVSALIRVPIEAAAVPSNGHDEDAEGQAAASRASLAKAIRAGDAAASEEAMRSLVEIDWRRMSEGTR